MEQIVITKLSNRDQLKMASTDFEPLALPEPTYGMGLEPIVGANICQHSDLSLVAKVKHTLGKASFTKLQSSFLGHIINLSARDIGFSGKIFHYLMLRRLKTRGRNLWFTVDMQPLRFSMREFFLTTGIQCEPIHREPRNNGKDPISEPYSWAVRGDYTLTQLQYRLFNEPEEGEEPLDDKEKECLAAVVLTEGILMTPNSTEKIPLSRLKHASDFEMYTAQPWGKEAYNILATCIQKFDKNTWFKGQYSVKGFPMALYIWALSAVPIFGDKFAIRCNFSRTFYPLILNWQSSRYARFDDVVEAIKTATCVEVKTIIGDPEEYKHLVDKDDNDFEEVIGLVMKGYRLKKEEWSTRLVDIYCALGELGDKMGEKLPDFEKQEKMEKNLSDSEKLDIILFMLDDFNKRLEAIEEAVKTTSGKDKDKGSHEDEDGQNRNEEVINEEAGKQNVDGDIARENFVESQYADSVRPSNTQDGSYAADDENTQKTGGDDGNYFEETPKDKSPSPRPSTPKFDLLSEEDEDSGKDKSIDKEKGASSKKRVLRERKQRKCKQSNDGDDDVMNRKERKKRKPSDNPDADIQAREGPQKKKIKSDDVGGVQRKSERNTIPSIHTQPPYSAEKKKDPILYPFSKVDKTRLDVFSDWKNSRKAKQLTILGKKVDAKWFTTLETPGKSLTTMHVDTVVKLLSRREESHPHFYKSKSLTLAETSFLREIDEYYSIFVDNKDEYEFPEEGFSQLFKEAPTNQILAPMLVKERLWMPLMINLEKKEMIIYDLGKHFYTNKIKDKQVGAYAVAMPYIAQKKFGMKNDTKKSPFRISIINCIPQVDKIEDSGVFMLKTIECLAMSITTHGNLKNESIGDLRKKMAVDIFAELQND